MSKHKKGDDRMSNKVVSGLKCGTQFIKTLLKQPKNAKYLDKWKKNRVQSKLEYLWMPFELNEWLGKRLSGNERVFEWGSGSSTIWLEKRTNKIISVEDDKEWVDKVKKDLEKSSSEVLFMRNKNGYVNAISKYGKFDVIIVDGKYRMDCFKLAKEHLNKNGIIIYDDVHYKDRFDGDLKEFTIIFKGLAPYKAFSNWYTGVFINER
jgi:hypothetical protein